MGAVEPAEVQLSKREWPKFISGQFGIPTIDGSQDAWLAKGGTVDRAWFLAMCEVLSVPYPGNRVSAMEALVVAVGGVWDAETMASTGTSSGGGGNVRKEAFAALWTGINSGPAGLSAMMLGRAERLGGGSIVNSDVPTQEKILQSILTRRGQRRFRSELLAAYGYRCAITGSDVIETLEAAHIASHTGGGAMAVANGLLLRADLHTLFDLDLIALDTATWAVLVSPKLLKTESAEEFMGRRLRLPAAKEHRPDVRALDAQRKRAGL